MINMPTKMVIAAGFALASHGASALIDVDGKFDGLASGKYSTVLGLSVGGVSGGFVALGENAGGQYLYFSNPRGFVDNSYGDRDATFASGSIGWGRTNKHRFSQLTGSDRAMFEFSAGGSMTTVELDYLSETGSGGANSDFVSLGTGGHGSGSFAQLTQVASSLQYNLATYSDTNLQEYSPHAAGVGGSTSDAADYVLTDAASCTSVDCGTNFDEWIYEAGYELHFAAGTFSSDVFTSQAALAGNFSGNTISDGAGN
ncbi:MAG: hypothetical protein ACI9W2_001521, partial [Gammaproteobacteria bacterium]